MIRARTEVIRKFILSRIPSRAPTLVPLICAKFDISRQAVSRHIRTLVDQGLVTAEGNTRARRYRLSGLWRKSFETPIEQGLSEDRLWRERVAETVQDLAPNVQAIWMHAFTEMVNNATDHSRGDTLAVSVWGTAVNTQMRIVDNGIGVFQKLKQDHDLEDERHAALELSKGKLSSDYAKHSGEGIFFTSRMCDVFELSAGRFHLMRGSRTRDNWLFESRGEDPVASGTTVRMLVDNETRRTTQGVFDRFTVDDEDVGFSKTVVPVELLIYGKEQLVSRSQAKRLLARFEDFEVVLLDFKGIRSIGQAFADEVFRVFPLSHPQTDIQTTNAGKAVRQMIVRATGS